MDGTLLDPSTYDYRISLPAVQALQKQPIPIILCSAKTRHEIEVYGRRLGIMHPFIVENGGAVVRNQRIICSVKDAEKIVAIGRDVSFRPTLEKGFCVSEGATSDQNRRTLRVILVNRYHVTLP